MCGWESRYLGAPLIMALSAPLGIIHLWKHYKKLFDFTIKLVLGKLEGADLGQGQTMFFIVQEVNFFMCVLHRKIFLLCKRWVI